MSYDTKDGIKCVLVALLVSLVLVGVYHLIFETKQEYLGKVVSIDVESSGGSIGGIRYYCLLDTGETHSFVSPKRIGEAVYYKRPFLRLWPQEATK